MTEQFEAARKTYFVGGMSLSWYRGWEAYYAGANPLLDNPNEVWGLTWQGWGEGWLAAYGYEAAKKGGWLDE